jgi:hypothetical protein
MKNFLPIASFLVLSFAVATAPAYAQVNLGTSSAANNPQRSGEAGTGLNSPASGATSISSGGSEIVRVTGTGVGIGTASPQAQLDVVTTSTPATRGIASYQYGTGSYAALLTLYKAGGTPSSPTAVTSSGYGSGINMDAYDGTNFLDTAGVSSRINGTIATGSVPQDLILYTTGGANDGDPYANGHVRMVITSGGNVGIGTTSPVVGGGLTIAPSASTSGTPSLLTITGPADTTLGASSEANDVFFNLNRTVQFATGALTTQRAFYIKPPTYSFVGASTITNAATVDISGPPVAGTNATITNPASLVVESGNVGIGTASPANPLTVNGIIQSLTGGYKFPDGTTQTTAATSAASTGMVLLATVNASAASSVSFGSSYITTTYNKYVLEFDDVYTSDGGTLYLTFSTNNGSSYLSSNYYYSILLFSTNGTFNSGPVGQIALGGGSSSVSTAGVTSNTSTTVVSGTVKCANLAKAVQASCQSDITFVTSNNGLLNRYSGIEYNSTTTAINAFKIVDDSGGTITGNFHLYGLSGI